MSRVSAPAQRALCGTVVALCCAQGVAAQTFDEAVRTNVAGLFTLCLQVMVDRVPPMDAFGGAGFTYRSVDRGVNDFGVDRGTGHYFDAPADTAKVEVPRPDQMAGSCTVTSRHLSEQAFAGVIAQTLFRFFPGAEVRSPTGWSAPTASGLPLIIGVSTIGNNNRYEAPGTVRVSMGFPG